MCQQCDVLVRPRRPSRVKLRAVAASVVVTSIALTSCAARAPVEPWAFGEFPSATPMATMTPEPEFDVSTLATGEVISEELARELNRNLGTGVRGYELVDGTFVVVRRNEPFPVAVRVDAEAKAAAIPLVTGTSPEEQAASANSGRYLADTLTFLTGKRVVVVHYNMVSFMSGSTRLAWRASEAPLNGQGLYPIGDSRDAVVAEAQALINLEANPSEWEIIVQPR